MRTGSGQPRSPAGRSPAAAGEDRVRSAEVTDWSESGGSWRGQGSGQPRSPAGQSPAAAGEDRVRSGQPRSPAGQSPAVAGEDRVRSAEVTDWSESGGSWRGQGSGQPRSPAGQSPAAAGEDRVRSGQPRSPAGQSPAAAGEDRGQVSRGHRLVRVRRQLVRTGQVSRGHRLVRVRRQLARTGFRSTEVIRSTEQRWIPGSLEYESDSCITIGVVVGRSVSAEEQVKVSRGQGQGQMTTGHKLNREHK